MLTQLFTPYDEFASSCKQLNTGQPTPPATKLCTFECDLSLSGSGTQQTTVLFVLGIQFWNDQAHQIYFSKADDSDISAEEASQLLNRNSGGATWSIQADQPQFWYRSDNKAVASYASGRKGFSIQGRELIAAQVRYQERARSIASPESVGPFTLGQPISAYPQIQKMSWWSSFDIKRPKVRGLKLYKSGRTIDFFGQPREVIIGSVRDVVWSMSVHFSFKTEDLMGDTLVKVSDCYTAHLGAHTSDAQYPLRWRTPSADITINAGSMTGIGVAFYFFTLTISAI